MKKIENSIRKAIKKEVKNKDLIYETLECLYNSILTELNDTVRRADFDTFVEFEDYVLENIKVVNKLNYKKEISKDKVDRLMERAISLNKEGE